MMNIGSHRLKLKLLKLNVVLKTTFACGAKFLDVYYQVRCSIEEMIENKICRFENFICKALSESI